MRTKRFFNLIIVALLPAALSAQSLTLSEQKTAGAITIADAAGVACIVTNSGDAEVVTTIAEAVASDIEAVTGQRPAVAHQLTLGTTPIIAGTVGRSEIVDRLAAEGKIDVSDIADHWESYALQLVENPAEGIARALVCYGQNSRATAYALFELTRMMGVSPWIWWADVAPEKKSEVYISGVRTKVDSPSVKFRGIFINDEDWGLQPWAAAGLDKKYNNVGPGAYAKVMELLLRLRANTLWPAMHLCSQAFWDNKDNLPVAKRYDIVLGSSHCEQMLRDNEWEWRRYEYDDPTGVYADGKYDTWNYNSPKKATIQRYWEERVEESKGYEAMYTLGMRGVHDWAISGYPSTQDKVNGLTEIIAFQRSLLSKHIGPAETVPQIFIPYKEVLEAYNAGLQVPEDVTLTWVDDNHGYIRQLPRQNEQARSGGNGIYYHVSYWGTPHDYLWLCSHSPSLISYELSKAYDQGIRNLWIINVGDIKPAEAEMEFAMDLAWDVERWSPEKAHEYSAHWAAETFGQDVADEIAAIKREYYRLGMGGKPEHVFAISYTTDEKLQRISDYTALVEKVEAAKASIRPELQDAYYQLIEYPVKGAYYMNCKQFLTEISVLEANHGMEEQALSHAAEARQAYRMIQTLTEKYNTGIANGKWNKMMSMKPRGLSQFNMPATATISSIANVKTEIQEQQTAVVPANAYTEASPSIRQLEGLGVSDCSVSVWPLDLTKYSSARYTTAPSVSYTIPVRKGKNEISARCLPTFPINGSYDLRVAVAVNNQKAEVVSLKTVATEGKWNTIVLQGYNDATMEYTAAEDGTTTVTVYMLDPGVVLSDIYVRFPSEENLELTERLIKNYDFELRQDGTPNPAGNTDRGIPYGWKSQGSLSGNSFGINQDAANPHGTNLCWINSTPMPREFKLYQAIPATEIEPGVYKVSCRLWVGEGKKTSCRLFANQNVQYYGYESDYTSLLTEGENATYAGYAGQNNGGPFNLLPMTVYVTVGEGEGLELGIKTGNRKNDGQTATDNAGWFKVDYFTIERVSEVPPTTEGEDLTLTEQLIQNYDFELYQLSNGTVRENTSGETRRGTTYGVYGWNIVGSFPGDSYGINNDCPTKHGNNCCWFQAKNGNFPDNFALQQTIPAAKLQPGRYAVYCKLWGEEDLLTTLRLFANNNAQLYGMEMDYGENLPSDENYTYAGYIGGVNGDFQMQDMFVYVDVAEDEDLTIGLKTNGRLADGSLSPVYKAGWFKTDFFRIHRIGNASCIALANTSKVDNSAVYTLSGVKTTEKSNPKGIYIKGGKKIIL